jgi:hypothetical protein
VVITLPKSADAKEVVRTIRELNPDVSIILRKHPGILEKEIMDEVFASIEPEFETAVKMLEKLMLILHHQPKRVSTWIKDNKDLLDGAV